MGSRARHPCIWYAEDVLSVESGSKYLSSCSYDMVARVVVWQAERPRICAPVGNYWEQEMEMGHECWSEVVPGMWVWQPECLLVRIYNTMFLCAVRGSPGADVLVQWVIGFTGHELADQAAAAGCPLAVCSDVPIWLPMNTMNSAALPGTDLEAADILYADVQAPLVEGFPCPDDATFDGVTWAEGGQQATLTMPGGFALFKVTPRITEAVIAGVFGTYEDGECAVPIGKLRTDRLPGCAWEY